MQQQKSLQRARHHACLALMGSRAVRAHLQAVLLARQALQQSPHTGQPVQQRLDLWGGKWGTGLGLRTGWGRGQEGTALHRRSRGTCAVAHGSSAVPPTSLRRLCLRGVPDAGLVHRQAARARQALQVANAVHAAAAVAGPAVGRAYVAGPGRGCMQPARQRGKPGRRSQRVRRPLAPPPLRPDMKLGGRRSGPLVWEARREHRPALPAAPACRTAPAPCRQGRRAALPAPVPAPPPPRQGGIGTRSRSVGWHGGCRLRCHAGCHRPWLPGGPPGPALASQPAAAAPPACPAEQPSWLTRPAAPGPATAPQRLGTLPPGGQAAAGRGRAFWDAPWPCRCCWRLLLLLLLPLLRLAAGARGTVAAEEHRRVWRGCEGQQQMIGSSTGQSR